MDTDPINQTGKSKKEQLQEATESCLERLRPGIQVIVARSGIVESRAAINDMADEILQVTIETAFRKADRFDPAKNIYAWLLSIATNIVKDYRKRANKEASRLTNIQDIELPSNTKPDDEQELDMAEDERLDALLYGNRQASRNEPNYELDQLLSLVDGGDREILRLTYVDEMNTHETAKRLGISEPAVYAFIKSQKAFRRCLLPSSRDDQRGLNKYGPKRDTEKH